MPAEPSAIKDLYDGMDEMAKGGDLKSILLDFGERAASGEPVPALVEELLPEIQAACKGKELELEEEEEAGEIGDEERPY